MAETGMCAGTPSRPARPHQTIRRPLSDLQPSQAPAVRDSALPRRASGLAKVQGFKAAGIASVKMAEAALMARPPACDQRGSTPLNSSSATACRRREACWLLPAPCASLHRVVLGTGTQQTVPRLLLRAAQPENQRPSTRIPKPLEEQQR
jgi:hypothetical protein